MSNNNEELDLDDVFDGPYNDVLPPVPTNSIMPLAPTNNPIITPAAPTHSIDLKTITIPYHLYKLIGEYNNLLINTIRIYSSNCKFLNKSVKDDIHSKVKNIKLYNDRINTITKEIKSGGKRTRHKKYKKKHPKNKTKYRR